MIIGYIILGLIFCHILYVHFIVRPSWEADDFNDDFAAFQQTLWSDSPSRVGECPQEPERDAEWEEIKPTKRLH